MYFSRSFRGSVEPLEACPFLGSRTDDIEKSRVQYASAAISFGTADGYLQIFWGKGGMGCNYRETAYGLLQHGRSVLRSLGKSDPEIPGRQKISP